jgi:hypothetical protein
MNKINIKKAGLLTGITICAITILVITANIPQIEKEERFQKVYIWTPTAAEADPGAGASGFLEIFFMNISSQDSNGYGLNTSSTHETWSDANLPSATPNAWASADNFDITYFDSETTFVFMVRVRYNKTHAWETDHFNGADCDTQITVTCTDWAVGGDINNVSGTAYETRNNTGEEFIWINFVWDNAGTGYQIADDSTMTISEIYIEAKY